MPKHWTAEERNTLKYLLTNGVELNALHVALPNRTAAAISREATKLNFRTKSLNGVKVLYDDIKRRNRVAKLKTSEAKKKNKEVAADVTITTRHSDTPATAERLEEKSAVMITPLSLTLTNTWMAINSKAVQMLHDADLKIDPYSILELSELIKKYKTKDM